jgi:ribonuclease III
MTPKNLQQRLGITFKNPHLLEQALTHRSYINENPSAGNDYERLEFLGDAILDFVVGEWVFKRHPNLSEGELTRIRSALVRTETLADIARGIRLGDYIRIGKGEERNGGRQRPVILCRALEALIGAIYLDLGIERVRGVLLPMLEQQEALVFSDAIAKDARTRLQEWVQSTHHQVPTYEVIAISGPDHARHYRVSVSINGEQWAIGEGKSILAASQHAATLALARIPS